MLFVFENFRDTAFTGFGHIPADDALAKTVHALWVSFIATGRPQADRIQVWPTYSSSARYTLLHEPPQGSGRDER